VNLRRSLLVPTLAAALVVPLTLDDAGHADPSATDRARARVVPDVRVLDRAPASSPGKWLGTDGNEYDYGPIAVSGKKGYFYYGADFDNACSVGGPGLKEAADELAKIANIIRRSGRRVVWTMAPNKSAPLARYIRESKAPHGKCARKGMAAQTKLLRRYRSPGYLPMVDPLARSTHQVYWRTDPHWSTVGGSIFAKEVARVLDPKLAAIQRSRYGKEVGRGSLNILRGIYKKEKLERAFPATPVKVVQRPSDTPWGGYPDWTFDTSWDTKPAKRTWPGKTLVVGDSFSEFALESLRPLFRHGRFMWFAHVALQDVVQAIRRADTVVLEVFELYVPNSIVSTKEFQRELRQGLR
jgi:hypothetical protein